MLSSSSSGCSSRGTSPPLPLSPSGSSSAAPCSASFLAIRCLIMIFFFISICFFHQKGCHAIQWRFWKSYFHHHCVAFLICIFFRKRSTTKDHHLCEDVFLTVFSKFNCAVQVFPFLMSTSGKVAPPASQGKRLPPSQASNPMTKFWNHAFQRHNLVG